MFFAGSGFSGVCKKGKCAQQRTVPEIKIMPAGRAVMDHRHTEGLAKRNKRQMLGFIPAVLQPQVSKAAAARRDLQRTFS
jgi:hypothetical protein